MSAPKQRSASSSRGGGDRASAKEAAAAKKAKEEAAKAREELVRAMADPAKADLLAQALLREYMHRKGFKKTLASFDEENPRTESTINSRELMNGLMSTQIIQRRNAQRGEGAAFATIMEVLCSYRLRKRELRGGSGSQGAAKAPYSLCGPEGASFDSSDEEEELSRMATAHTKAIADREATNAAVRAAHAEAVAAAEAAAAAAPPSESKKEKRKKDKDSDGEKKKDKKKKASADSLVPAGGGGGRRAFDPLGLGGGGAYLPTTPAPSSSTGFGSSADGGREGAGTGGGGGLSARGRWTPGGGASVPSVGISSSSSGLAFGGSRGGADADDAASYRPPTFSAGNGFTLSSNAAKVCSTGAADVWEGGGRRPAPWSTGGGGFGTSPNGRLGSTDREEVPSPYAKLGQVKFDANAKAKSVLSKQTYGLGGQGSAMSSSASSPILTTSSSVGQRTGRRITWGGEASEPTSSVGSPVSPQPSGGVKTGIYFNTSPGSPGNSGRQRQRPTVKIIEAE